MTTGDSFPDEVPVADALEQIRQAEPAGQPDDLEDGVGDDAPAPLESDPADWQEQREIVEDPEDDFR